MTYDHEIILVNHSYCEDQLGNQIPVETRTPVLCGLKSVGRNEFYSAAAAGLKPTMVFVIHGYEYNGEQIIELGSERYRVVRTYAVSFEELELTCEQVVGDG